MSGLPCPAYLISFGNIQDDEWLAERRPYRNIYLVLVEALIYYLRLKCQHTECIRAVELVKKWWNYWIKCRCLCERWMCYDYFYAYPRTAHYHNLAFMNSSRIMIIMATIFNSLVLSTHSINNILNIKMNA